MRHPAHTGVIEWDLFGGFKQCKRMVDFEGISLMIVYCYVLFGVVI